MTAVEKKQWFGTDGIRGVVGEHPITPDFFYRLGKAAGQFLVDAQSEVTLLIGRDTRASGEVLSRAFSRGALAAGVQVLDCGVCSTPALACMVLEKRVSGAVMITASHNPAQDNGIKFFNDKGQKLPDASEEAIEKNLAAIQEVANINHSVDPESLCILDSYRDYCMHALDHPTFSSIGIVADLANGGSVNFVPSLLVSCGVERLDCIGDQPDGQNINLNCGATSLGALQHAVKQSGADIGMAFDGDGDRVMLVDALGEVVDGDQILGILALHHNLEDMRDTGVVGTLMTNLGLERALEEVGIPFVRAAVGDRYVLAELLERGWFLGGESSGHILNLHLSPTGDGGLAALQVLSVMQKTGRSLSELASAIKKFPQEVINISTNASYEFSEDDDIHSWIASEADRLSPDYRLLVRASGTEPLIRVMVEGEDADKVHQEVRQIAERVQEKVGVCQ